MREFFGIGGYQRTPEGYFSPEHLIFVTCFMVLMVTLAVIFGKRNRHASDDRKNRVLIIAAILIDSFEIFKIVMTCIARNDPMGWIIELPLFLCSIQLITIPLAAFAKGRVKEAALDFVFIFGILGAVLGTYLAGNNYSCYPVLSFDNTVSAITHSISGFSSLYIAISGMASMKKKNTLLTFAILIPFCVAAYIANVIIDYNYMFLMEGDGTPYDILYNLLDGNRVLYPISVVLLFFVYIVAFRKVYELIYNKCAHKDGECCVAESEEKEAAKV